MDWTDWIINIFLIVAGAFFVMLVFLLASFWLDFTKENTKKTNSKYNWYLGFTCLVISIFLIYKEQQRLDNRAEQETRLREIYSMTSEPDGLTCGELYWQANDIRHALDEYIYDYYE